MPNILKNLFTLLLIAGIVGIGILGVTADMNGTYQSNSDEFEKLAMPYIEVADFKSEVAVSGDVVMGFYNGEENGVELYKKYSTTKNIYAGNAPVLKYEILDMPEGVTVEKQTIELSRTNHKNDIRTYTPEADERSIAFANLCADSTYYYRMSVSLSNGASIKTAGKFETMAGPRLISADGLWNVRDIGGVTTMDGKVVKQNVLYRGSAFDVEVEEEESSEKKYVDLLLNELEIRTEIDLTKNVVKSTKSEIGQSVSLQGVKLVPYELQVQKYAAQPVAKLFAELASSRTFPAYMHCDYGTDATGTVCYLLDMLLGVSKEEAYRRWELSALQYGEIDYKAMDGFVEAFDELAGRSSQNKAEGYLLSIGVTEEQIAAIKNNFLE